jgi:hypothetical protein
MGDYRIPRLGEPTPRGLLQQGLQGTSPNTTTDTGVGKEGGSKQAEAQGSGAQQAAKAKVADADADSAPAPAPAVHPRPFPRPAAPGSPPLSRFPAPLAVGAGAGAVSGAGAVAVAGAGAGAGTGAGEKEEEGKEGEKEKKGKEGEGGSQQAAAEVSGAGAGAEVGVGVGVGVGAGAGAGAGAAGVAGADSAQAPNPADALQFLQDMIDTNLNKHCVQTSRLAEDEKRFLIKMTDTAETTDKAGGREDAKDHGTNTTTKKILQWERIKAFFESAEVNQTTRNLFQLAVWLIVLKCCDWNSLHNWSRLEQQVADAFSRSTSAGNSSSLFLLTFLYLQESVSEELVPDEQRSQLIKKAKEEYEKSKKSDSELSEKERALERQLLQFELVKQSTDLAGPSETAERTQGLWDKVGALIPGLRTIWQYGTG